MGAEWGDLTVANTLMLGDVIEVPCAFSVALLSLRDRALLLPE
jgi:hypothetical protein